MGAFHFTVRDDFSARLRQASAPASARAAHILAIQIAKDTEKYVPAITKSLSNRTIVYGNTIIYPGPYARYLYYGKLMVDPATGSPWASKGVTKVLTDRNLVFNKSVHGKAQAHWFEAAKSHDLDKWKRVAERAFVHELKSK